jgi:hypothetical protein
MPIYVQHQVLGRIQDVFNAEAIWQAPGFSLFSRRPLLRDLLERSPREHRGRAATRCFSHVTLMLPQEDVDDDYHLTRGARARDLAQTLAALHQKDFGDLLGGDQVRYDVVGDETLPPGQVEVRFGHAVYLPAPDEKVLHNVSVSRDSAVWTPVCPIYPNQRLALLGGEGSETSYSVPGWQFGPDAAILIINDGPDAPPVVQMRPKEGYECRYDPRAGYYTIRLAHGDETAGGPRLLLRITRAQSWGQAVRSEAAAAGAPPAPDRPAAASSPISPGAAPQQARGAQDVAQRPAVWQSRGQSQAQTAAPLTRILSGQPAQRPTNRPGESDATYAPVARQRVSLVALALPRLSRYSDTGASALELPFDCNLALAGGAAPAISITVNAADELYASTDAGRERISAPSTFTPVDARAIALQPAAPGMADRYCALLSLPQPVSAPVASGVRFVFGRSSAMLAALRVLDSPRFLQRAGGADGASADRIGLSRNAFSFEAADDGFRISRLSASQALYHLDDKLDFVAAIAEADPARPYLLPSGHHLAAGHYVLRFEA